MFVSLIGMGRSDGDLGMALIIYRDILGCTPGISLEPTSLRLVHFSNTPLLGYVDMRAPLQDRKLHTNLQHRLAFAGLFDIVKHGA